MARSYSFLFLLLVTFSFQIFSQSVTSSALNGTVRDEKGNPLENATVAVIHQPSGSVYGATTRADGKYNVNNLRAGGPYKVVATYVGYGKQESNNVNLKLGQNLELNFTLTNQSVEMVEISVTGSRGEIINSNRTGAATNVTEQVIETFPTVNRNFQDFVKFTPQFSGTSFSAAGRNNKYNNLQVDGTQFNDKFGLGSTGLPGGQANITPLALESVQEFQVVVAPYDVRYGGFTGGGINAVTKYGTNDWRASGYYYTRNQDWAGKSPDTLKKKLANFSEYQTGIGIGGPILQDKLFFYANGELTKRNEAISNIALTQFSGSANVQALADRFRSILQRYGYDPGNYNDINKERPSGKLFLRLDYNLSDIHKLTLRHNYVDGSDLIITPNSSTVIFPDNAYKFATNTNSTALQLTSTFSNTISNELILGYLRIRDRRQGVNPRPFSSIQVRESGLQFWAGGEPFSQANELDQDVFEFTDNFSYFLGDHVITAGTHNEFYSIRNMFTRDFYGSYIFSSMNNFDSAIVNGVGQAGRVLQYDYSYANKDPRWAASFKTMQLGFYLQDEWSVLPTLKLTGGIRVDIPIFPDKPTQNDTLTKYFGQFGVSTSKIPSGNMLFSPRVAFNWDMRGDRTAQLRGGAGIFTGSLPYVWLSNNYSNTGLEITRIRAANTNNNLRFTLDPLAQQKSAELGATPFTSEADVADANLKMPQVGRFNVGFDYQLPFNLTGTLEVLYTKAVNDLYYQNLNVADQTGTAIDGRPLYAVSKRSNKFTDVLVLKNTNKGYSYNLSAQLQGQPIQDLYVNTAYTFGQAKDVNSVASSQALSQWQFNPIDGNPNDPKLTTSNYELKHRVYLGLSYSVDFVQDYTTTFSLFYNGQSGRPFSYCYFGDANLDGFNQNDLIYIPKDNDPNVILNNGTTWNAINTFINNDDYLKEHRGQVAERNTSREPWISTVDFKLTQKVPVYGRHNLEFSLDVLNILNLLNSDWGWVKTVTNQSSTAFTFSGYDAATGKQKIGFSGVKDPFTNDNLLSRFQMQLGARYSF